MNRHDRRAAGASKPRQKPARADIVATALAALRGATDTVTGATVILPDGAALYVSRETAEAMAPPTRSHVEHLKAIHREAAGIMTLDVVLREDLPDLIAAAVTGDPTAATLLARVNKVLADIVIAGTTTEYKLCACCPRPLEGAAFSVVIATPACDNPHNTIALGICNACGTARETVRAKAIEALRNIWPDVRPINITHPAGGSGVH